MWIPEFNKETKFVTFDGVLGRVEFDHLTEGEAAMQIIWLFRTAYAIHAHDGIGKELDEYVSSVQELTMETLGDSEDRVSFKCYDFNKIHLDVYAKHNELIDAALDELEILEFGDCEYVFQCHCPSER